MRRIAAIAVILSALALTGCGLTLDELIEQRQKCEDAGGVFEQWRDSIGGERARCDLSTTNQEET